MNSPQQILLADALPVLKGATFSRGQANRLTLTRDWDLGNRRVCFVGLNPSTADAERDDPTVRRWSHFARAWGFTGFVAVNLYPFRTSSPAECRRRATWYARDDMHCNLEVVAQETKGAALVVVCWGAAAWDLDYVETAVEEIHGGEPPYPDLYCFGTTGSGAPIHPLARGRHRVPDSAQPVLWREAEPEGHQE